MDHRSPEQGATSVRVPKPDAETRPRPRPTTPNVSNPRILISKHPGPPADKYPSPPHTHRPQYPFSVPYLSRPTSPAHPPPPLTAENHRDPGLGHTTVAKTPHARRRSVYGRRVPHPASPPSASGVSCAILRKLVPASLHRRACSCAAVCFARVQPAPRPERVPDGGQRRKNKNSAGFRPGRGQGFCFVLGSEPFDWGACRCEASAAPRQFCRGAGGEGTGRSMALRGGEGRGRDGD